MYGKIIWQLIGEFQRDFLRKLQHPVGTLKVTEDFECSFQSHNFRSRVK